ncbi:MAG: M23 family metallopeptidase [Gemmatimonadetes bacterium]|nr:M23 family metallopeptidase [Gemmatimonadota bacterium]NNF12821.1 M23 family metallopeptidase [Gemmatimonadota bacterium]NNL30365.1 M23 family metallopeptidase [Gemmatimonadota bacterium]
MMHRALRPPIVLAIVCLSATGCEQVEQVQDRFRDLTPYEAYQESLVEAGLAQTALARDWMEAGRAALDGAAPVSLPFAEEGFITAEEPGAMAYRISVPRGQKLTADVSLQSEEGTQVFVELFRVPSSDGDPLRPVFSFDSIPGAFEHEPWRGGDFVLRLQPELLRGGQYRVVLRLQPQLAFPVEGHGMQAIQSTFGMPRDGGRRSHHGVDIFARRGTPVLATSDGVVNRVDVTSIGGKVVWLRDPVRNANIYYAHLDSQYVGNGERVQRGDTVGFVGNSGNARTTPPHLHFGVYRRGEGPIDPAPFLRPPEGALAELTADLGHLGAWVRLRNDGIRLRAAPGLRSPVLRELEVHTPLRVLGGSGEYFRVRLPDGGQGYVAARLTEPVDEPLTSQIVAAAEIVRVRPATEAPVMARLEEGTEVPVLGRFDGYLYVRSPEGLIGWMSDAAQQ